MATHSRTLAWRIPWTEEPGGTQSAGPQRVGHDWSDLAHIHLGENQWNWHLTNSSCFYAHFPLCGYENSYINLTPKMQFQRYDLGQCKCTSSSRNFLLYHLQLIFMMLTLISTRYQRTFQSLKTKAYSLYWFFNFISFYFLNSIFIYDLYIFFTCKFCTLLAPFTRELHILKYPLPNWS